LLAVILEIAMIFGHRAAAGQLARRSVNRDCAAASRFACSTSPA